MKRYPERRTSPEHVWEGWKALLQVSIVPMCGIPDWAGRDTVQGDKGTHACKGMSAPAQKKAVFHSFSVDSLISPNQ